MLSCYNYWYTLEELLQAVRNESYSDYYHLWDLLYTVLMVSSNSYSADYFSNILETNDIDNKDMFGYIENEDHEWVINKHPLTKLVTILLTKYGGEYVASCDSNENFVSIYSGNTLPVVLKSDNMWRWVNQFIQVLIRSYARYYSILNIYQDNLNKLMNGLKKESSMKKDDDYEINATGETLHNDTPQTTDVVADLDDNQYVSDLSKNSGNTTNKGSSEVTGTEVYDNQYVIDKIASIQDKYRQVLNDWADEFRGLFLEEANLE